MEGGEAANEQRPDAFSGRGLFLGEQFAPDARRGAGRRRQLLARRPHALKPPAAPVAAAHRRSDGAVRRAQMVAVIG